MTGKKTPQGQVIYKGSVPATDPMYNEDWTFLGGKNLNPNSAGKSKPQEEMSEEEAFKKHRERQQCPLKLPPVP